jgi:hypothetical protein
VLRATVCGVHGHCVWPVCVWPACVWPVCVWPVCVWPACVWPACVWPACVWPACVWMGAVCGWARTVEATEVSSNCDVLVRPRLGDWKTAPLGTRGEMSIAAAHSHAETRKRYLTLPIHTTLPFPHHPPIHPSSHSHPAMHTCAQPEPAEVEGRLKSAVVLDVAWGLVCRDTFERRHDVVVVATANGGGRGRGV